MSVDIVLNDPRVRRVLELAAEGTPELQVPWELRDAVQWCMVSQLVKLQRAELVAPAPFPESWLKGPDTLVVVHPDEGKEDAAPLWLILTPSGGEELVRLRLQPPSESQPESNHQEWTEAKSPTDWQKELGMSPSKWRAHIKQKQLIVDRITPKLVRIRLDSLRRYTG